MNNPNNRILFTKGSLILLAAAIPLTASADLYWDGNDTTIDADGGSGVWDTSSLNWDGTATAGPSTAWSNLETAVFGGTAGGAVSVATGGITAAGIKVSTNGYTLQDNTLTLGAGAISVDSGIEATVASTINGSLNKTGPGTLILTGTNSFGGNTVISAGTLKVGAGSPTAFRYYRFLVSRNGLGTNSFNQLSELHYYKAGVWTPATNGTPGTSTSGEGWWNNANDNKGTASLFSKFGITGVPYNLTYDFVTPTNFDSYNWATGNDLTPDRNPTRWQVLGSTDGTNFTILDDRTNLIQAGPSAFYTWSGTTTPYIAVDNSQDGGATNSYPIPYTSRTPMPTSSPVQIAAGATLDLNGRSQTIASLADSAGGGGTVLSSVAATPVTFEIGNPGNTSTSFSGVIADGASPLTLIKSMASAQTLTGSAPNTYTGGTILAGMGKLVLSKPDGVNAIPGDVSIASHTFNGNSSGIVLAANEQIADSAIVTYPETSYGGGTMGDTYFRLNGKTETIRGLSATRGTGIGAPGNFAVVENRGLGDAVTTYGAGKVIINTPVGETYTYLGSLRDKDGGTTNGGTVGITKTGAGTQILGGQMSSATGPSEVNAGILRVTNPITTPVTSFSWAAPMTVTGTGRLEGNANITAAITVTGSGVFVPGLLGAPFTNGGGTTASSGGTLSFEGGSLAGAATIGSGGFLTGAGTITGAVNAQAGSTVTPGGASIGTLTTNAAVTLAGALNIDVNKTGGVLTYDKISNFTAITLGGTLALNFTGEALVPGESFQILAPATAASVFTGSFTGITGLPTPPAGQQWDTTQLAVSGTIKLIDTAVPPVFSPPGGAFVGAQTLTLSGDPGTTIYYTLDGTDPTPSSPGGPAPVTGIIIPTDAVTTVKAITVQSGFFDSPVVTKVFKTATTPKWIVDANGNWTDAVNWYNDVVPNAADVTADFTLTQSAARTVTLNAARTVGKLAFANANSFAWTISGANTLTLATTTGAPEIAVADVGTAVDVDATISSSIAGTQGFTKTGTGTLALTGAKPYTGTIAINGGRVSTDALAANGTNSPLGAGTALSIDGGTLRYTGSGSNNTFNRTIALGAGGGTVDTSTPANFWFLNGVISGSGSLTKVGTRQLIIQAANTYDGQTFINEGEVQIRTLDSLGSTVGNTVVANGARLAVGAGFGTNISPENLNLTGMGNTNAGALQTNDGGVVPTFSGSVTLNGDTGIGGTASPVVTLTLSGAIGGTGNLIKVGTNTLALTGSASNTYVGTTTVANNGKLLLNKSGGAIAIPGNINLSSSGAFTANATGVVLAADEQIADSAVLTWTTTAYPTGTQSDSYFRLNGKTETIGGLVSTGNGAKAAIENRGNGDAGTYVNGNLIINTTGTNSYSYNGNIRNVDGGTGSGGLITVTKTGTGTQAFTGTLISYTGATTVNGGTLLLNNTGFNSPVTVNSGGTLGGTGTSLSTVAVVSGGKIAPGASAGTLTAGSVTLAGTYVCEVDGATADRLSSTGSLDVTGATLDFDVLTAPTLDSYIIASYTGTLTGSFTVVDLPTGYEVYSDTTAKTVLLRKVQGFAGYATANGLTGNVNDDFDKDGLADGVEYVLGTSPTAGSNTSAAVPVAAVVGGNLEFTFTRADASMTPDITVKVETSTLLDPVSWTSYNVGATTATSSPEITVTDNGATDTIKLTVPKSAAGVLFARLKVTVTPP